MRVARMTSLHGFEAVILKKTAYKTNIGYAKKWGWSVKSGYSGPGDKKLARDVYCFQHDVEGCSGSCQPDKKVVDCYNRDGMVGDRTLTLMANAIAENTAWGQKWAATINIPSRYDVTKPAPPPPASDVRSDVAAGQGIAGQKHYEIAAAYPAQVAQASGGTSSGMLDFFKTKKGMMIAGGGVLAVGIAAYMAFFADKSESDDVVTIPTGGE